MINAQLERAHAQALALITDEANPAGIQQLAEHIAQCSACCEAEALMQTLLARYRAQEAPPLRAAVEQRILEACCDCLATSNQRRKQ